MVRDLIVEVLADLGYTAGPGRGRPGGARPAAGTGPDRPSDRDVGLPGGLDGRQRWRRPARTAGPEGLFITGYAENATFGTGHLETGMQMITKPFSVEVLAARVRAMIAGRD